jgi:hypothetical protein
MLSGNSKWAGFPVGPLRENENGIDDDDDGGDDVYYEGVVRLHLGLDMGYESRSEPGIACASCD